MTANLSTSVPPAAIPSGRRGDNDRSLRTRELFEAAAQCDDEARHRRLLDEVVIINLEVADSLASQFSGRGVSTDDLVQTARLELVRVARNFSLDRDCDFLAYAVPSIRGTLKRYFRDHGWMVRPPRRLQEARLNVNSAVQRLGHTLGHEPTTAELAGDTGLDEEVVDEALRTASCYSPDSLDRPVGTEDDSTLGAVVADDDEDFARLEERMWLGSLLRGVPERERRVIELRFVHGLTQAEVGRHIGVSQMQVSRILTRVLHQLRTRAAQQSTAVA